jgi:hypothetical protein
MEIQTQYSVFLVNKPGVLANVCRVLADHKINIRAMTLVDSSEHGVLRVVVENGGRAETVLAALNLPLTKTEVICVDLPNEPGALATVAEKLAREHININYGYVSSGAPGGRTFCVLKVADIKKAEKVLQAIGKFGTRDQLLKTRATPNRRR